MAVRVGVPMTEAIYQDRAVAEHAFRVRSQESGTHGSVDVSWPPAARRIQELRRRTALSDREVARSAGITPDSYRDLEGHESEAFIALPLAKLASLALVLGTDTRTLLLGPAASEESQRQETSFSVIAQRLREKAGSSPDDVATFGNRIGWDCEPILDNPEILWAYDVEALFAICAAVGVDWVSAIPTTAKT